MPKLNAPLLVLSACLVLVVCAGAYVTFVQEPDELERLQKAEEVVRLKETEMKDLLSEYAASKQQANQVIGQWNSRYKIVPDTLASPSVVGYMNELTQRGFETFDISIQGVRNEENYSYYALRATGRGYFSNLYRFIWEVENNRDFYAVNDLTLNHIDLETENKETGRKKLQVMVSFNMSINAYFGGPEGINSSGSQWRPVAEENVSEYRSKLPPVPSKILADDRPDINPFFPVIMDQLPPNTRGLVDVEKASFVSIVGGEAVFKDEQGFRQLGVGDDVYLGQVTSVDPTKGRLTAVLNRGGIIDDVELFLETEEAYRQAMGPTQISPASPGEDTAAAVPASGAPSSGASSSGQAPRR